jgi:hypothetical protein
MRNIHIHVEAKLPNVTADISSMDIDEVVGLLPISNVRGFAIFMVFTEAARCF